MNKGKPEKEVLKECLSVLKRLEIFAYRQNTGAFKTQTGFFRSSIAGVSDIIGCLPDGRFLAIECKREKGGRVSEAQEKYLSMIDKNHGVAIVANDSKKLEEILEKILKKSGVKRNDEFSANT